MVNTDGFVPDDIQNVGPSRAIEMLRKHGKVETPIGWHPDREDSPTVPVVDGDYECSGCNCLVDEYRRAPYLLVLAQMKRKYDTNTYCQTCLERKHERAREAERAAENEVVEA